MTKTITILIALLVCKAAVSQKLVTTYFDWNKIHPHEQYYVNAAGQKNGTYKEYNQGGVVVKEYNFLNGLENGPCTEYAATENNQRVVVSKGGFKNGKGEGPFVEYCDEDGYKSKVQEGKYVNGKKTGLWTEWWCTEIYSTKYYNKIKNTGYYADNVRHGDWKDYTENGQMTEAIYDHGEKVNASGKFADGKRTGRWTYHYNNGSVSYTGDFISDKETGQWIYYNQDGKLDRKGAFINGKTDGPWSFFDPTDSVKPIFTNNWSQGNPTGEWVTYYDSNMTEIRDRSKFFYYSKKTYDNKGTLQYGYRYYYITGEKYWDRPMTMKNDQLVEEGLYKVYFKNGKIELEGNFSNGKKTGVWKTYFENGNLESEAEYDQAGVLINTYTLYYNTGKPKQKTYYDKYGRNIGVTKYDENGKEL